MRLTLTGFDHTVTTEELDGLRPLLSYSFLELGILFSHRDGRARYPDYATRRRIASLNDDLPMAAHLCGALSRSVQAGDEPGFLEQDELRRYARIQINGYSPQNDASLNRVLAAHPDKEFILQVAGSELPVLAALPNVSVLLDASGGLGIRRESWPEIPKGVKFGCAGGLRPETLPGDLRGLPPGCQWADLETGLRDSSNVLSPARIEVAVDGFWQVHSPKRTIDAGHPQQALLASD